ILCLFCLRLRESTRRMKRLRRDAGSICVPWCVGGLAHARACARSAACTPRTKLEQAFMRALRSFLRDFWRVAGPYWYGEDRWRARALLALLVAMNLASVYLAVLFNAWNNDFYNTFQSRDFAAFKWQLLRFCVLATGFIVLGVYQLY